MKYFSNVALKKKKTYNALVLCAMSLASSGLSALYEYETLQLSMPRLKCLMDGA